MEDYGLWVTRHLMLLMTYLALLCTCHPRVAQAAPTVDVLQRFSGADGTPVSVKVLADGSAFVLTRTAVESGFPVNNEVRDDLGQVRRSGGTVWSVPASGRPARLHLFLDDRPETGLGRLATGTDGRIYGVVFSGRYGEPAPKPAEAFALTASGDFRVLAQLLVAQDGTPFTGFAVSPKTGRLFGLGKVKQENSYIPAIYSMDNHGKVKIETGLPRPTNPTEYSLYKGAIDPQFDSTGALYAVIHGRNGDQGDGAQVIKLVDKGVLTLGGPILAATDGAVLSLLVTHDDRVFITLGSPLFSAGSMNRVVELVQKSEEETVFRTQYTARGGLELPRALAEDGNGNLLFVADGTSTGSWQKKHEFSVIRLSPDSSGRYRAETLWEKHLALRDPGGLPMDLRPYDLQAAPDSSFLMTFSAEPAEHGAPTDTDGALLRVRF